MFLKFPGPTDLESWARDYCLEAAATEVGPVVTGIGGYIGQHTHELLAVTITARWVSSRHKLIAAGCAVVQDGDAEGTPSFGRRRKTVQSDPSRWLEASVLSVRCSHHATAFSRSIAG
jgi:hypothetical protein